MDSVRRSPFLKEKARAFSNARLDFCACCSEYGCFSDHIHSLCFLALALSKL
jgi:hypothetical protein